MKVVCLLKSLLYIGIKTYNQSLTDEIKKHCEILLNNRKNDIKDQIYCSMSSFMFNLHEFTLRKLST